MPKCWLEGHELEGTAHQVQFPVVMRELENLAWLPEVKLLRLMITKKIAQRFYIGFFFPPLFLGGGGHIT